MGSKRPNLEPPSSSSAEEDSSSEEEQQPAYPPPAKKPSPKTMTLNTKPSSKSPQKPTVADDDDDDDGDEEDESDDSTVAVKKDLKEKEDKEVEASSEEEEEEEDEQEEEPAKQQPLKKPDSSALSGSGSDSGSDSDSEPSEKQVVAKVEPAAESGRKRQRISAPSEVENSGKKQKLFQRFWGQSDETKILEAIISFYSNKGSEPPSNVGSGADLDGILDLLKKSVTAEFTKNQLNSKIRNLRRKFQTNASREIKNAGLKFSKPHDQEVYELSKKIWQLTEPLGDGTGGVKSVKSKGKGVKSMKSKGKSSTLNAVKGKDDGDDSEVDACYEYLAKAIAWAKPLNMDNLSINKGLKLIDPAKASPLEKRLRALESERFGHRMKWMDKLEEASQMIRDAVAKSG